MNKLRNEWAVVAYEAGKAVDAVYEGRGLYATASTGMAYTVLQSAQGVRPELSWAVVQLHRGVAENLLLELGEFKGVES